MKHLYTLTPAEIILLLNGGKASPNDLLKSTFIDLLLKKVLASETIIKKTGKKPIEKQVVNITSGEHLKVYSSLPHENVFLKAFNRKAERKITLNNMVKIAYKNGISKKHYLKLITESTRIRTGFNKSFLYKLYGKIPLNETGLVWKKEIENEIEVLNKEISSLVENDQIKESSLIKNLYGNIFFFRNLLPDILKEIKFIFADLSQNKDEEDDGFSILDLLDFTNDSEIDATYTHTMHIFEFGGGAFGGGGAGGDWGDSLLSDDSSGDFFDLDTED